MRKRETLKAGCVVIDKTNKKVALIYREKQNDYEFPKGHLELNENLRECAIRETAEEIKRDIKIDDSVKPFQMVYNNKKDGRCRCYYYLAFDLKQSDNTSVDTHKLIWTDFDKVKDILVYQSCKEVWDYFFKKLFDILL